MTDSADGHITRLLHDWQSGDREALDRLIPLVCDELRLMSGARERIRSRLTSSNGCSSGYADCRLQRPDRDKLTG